MSGEMPPERRLTDSKVYFREAVLQTAILPAELEMIC